MKPIVSVIMAVYNAAQYLDQSITSILCQTYDYFEFIIIDDCSTDNSYEIIRKYQKKDSRIFTYNNRENKGPAETRNIGLDIAKGKYIAINDADDISLPNRLKLQVDYLETNSEVFLLGGAALVCFKDFKPVKKRVCSGIKKNARDLPRYNHMIHSTVMFRNRIDIKYRKKFPMSQDYDLFLNILSKGLNIDNLVEPLVYYTVDDSSISSTKNIMRILFSRKVREFYKQRMLTGKDDYDNFAPDHFLKHKNNRFFPKRYNGLQNYINIIIYENRLEALKIIFKNMNDLPLAYIAKKLLLFILPNYLMQFQRKLRN